MTIEQFRELLTDYLTEPEYADVTPVDVDGALAMRVRLDGGEQFLVTIKAEA